MKNSVDVVGVKELKDHLSRHLGRVRRGERLLITDRGSPIAALSPVDEGEETTWAWELVRSGGATWRGGKPMGSSRRRRVQGKSTAEMVLEDRR